MSGVALPVRNTVVGDGERDDRLVEFVCLAKHRADATNGAHSVERNRGLFAYCARGAQMNHEWVRVPPTAVHAITIGEAEDRPPLPPRPIAFR